MNGKKNMRRISVLVTAQTAYNLEKLAAHVAAALIHQVAEGGREEMAEMTKEQAAMVLDPESSEEAMEEIKRLSGYTEEDMELKVIRDACRVAVKALRFPCDFVELNKIVPLTLEQLREMDGQPVWIVESPDWGHWELSEDAKDYLCDRDADLYGLTYPDSDGKAGLHKLGWLAYAYKPAHVDWEALQGSWEGEADGYADGELVYDVWRCGDCGHVEETDDPDLLPRFCPSCGRAMTPEALAEMEKRLRG